MTAPGAEAVNQTSQARNKPRHRCRDGAKAIKQGREGTSHQDELNTVQGSAQHRTSGWPGCQRWLPARRRQRWSWRPPAWTARRSPSAAGTAAPWSGPGSGSPARPALQQPGPSLSFKQLRCGAAGLTKPSTKQERFRSRVDGLSGNGSYIHATIKSRRPPNDGDVPRVNCSELAASGCD